MANENGNAKSFRGNGISDGFTNAFKKSRLFTDIYKKHPNDVIIGVRDGYVCLYYNCDCIAKVDVSQYKEGKELEVEIDHYYTNKNSDVISETELCDNFEFVKSQSDKRNKQEKQSQERLFIENNNNERSNWYCIDVEYTRSNTDWRFDIIAISKKAPHRVALIELKYGNSAIGGESGIRKHIADFHDFWKNNSFAELKPELFSIVNTLIKLGVKVPTEIVSLQGTTSEEYFSQAPEFYFITLNNNKEKDNGSTPQQSMGGYLFKDTKDAPNPWHSKRISTPVKDGSDYYDLIDHDKSFIPTFLFTDATLPNLGINDIIDDAKYSRYTIR